MELLLFLSGSALYLLVSRIAWLGRRDLIDRGAFDTRQFTAAFASYALLAGFVAAAAWSGAWTLPIRREAGALAGLVICLAGLALHLAARSRFTFRNAWGLDTELLVTTGIYRFLRHPQNVGLGCVFTGIALCGRSGVALAFVAVYAVTCLVWLPIEEKAMERRFGAQYAAYRARTPAFNPLAGFFGRRARRSRPRPVRLLAAPGRAEALRTTNFRKGTILQVTSEVGAEERT